jgi:hypothetical protein
VKLKKAKITRRFSKIPSIEIEDSERKTLTSYSGLIIFQNLFQKMQLNQKLQFCFKSQNDSSKVFPLWWTTQWLIVHLVIGGRKLRDIDYYRNDPLVERVLGVTQLPDVSTISRNLKTVDSESIALVRNLIRETVLDRVLTEKLYRVTLDFDGSVQGTKRHAEGSAVGFNKLHKGRRSYYPLFCTISQTAQFLDLHHRPGNVHDSNGAEEFVKKCIFATRQKIPNVVIETRMDSAFFQEELVDTLNAWEVEFSVSLPFHRFVELKELVEQRKRWRTAGDFGFFESDWSPGSWAQDFRLIFVRTEKKMQIKGPLQLDFFEPYDWDYDYQVIMTNKKQSAKKVIEFHHGRGSQEKIFSQAKTHMQMDNIPVKTLNGNKLYCMASMLAHNLNHELQIATQPRERGTTERRSPLWIFRNINTIRQNLIQKAGRLIRPQRKLTLVMGANEKVRQEILKLLAA